MAGFVGSSLARAILGADPSARITGIDDLSYGALQRLDDLRERIRFLRIDVADMGQALAGERFDVIVHCAAIAPLPECQVDSRRAIEQNVGLCGAVADFASISGSRDIVFLSSGAVYEGSSQFPTREDTPIRTRLVYPTTKILAEHYFEAMCRSHGLNVVAIRLFNLYGPHQDYFRQQPPLIGYLLRQLLRGEEAVLFSDGEQRRDYVYIDDLLDLVLRCAADMRARPQGGRFRAVNAGSGSPVSVNAIIDELERLHGTRLRVVRQPAQAYWDGYGELFQRQIPLRREIIEREVDKHTHASTEYALSEFGWRARVPLAAGLRACLDGAKTLLREPH